MSFADHPENEGFPADVTQGFTLWNVLVQMAQSYEFAIDQYRETLELLLMAIGNKESEHDLFSNHPELAVKMQLLMAADEGDHITPDHLANIPAMLVARAELPAKAVEAMSKLISMRLEAARQSVEVATSMQEILEENREQVSALRVSE
ncbi:MAG TPA: hypothetical protein VJU59_35835 [Paraburkholderia sp.]|uniref:hypothetical protein n=1 Tax=Paraburkholderia sp. TaxID=1926495 RepID=UPI002B4A170E|nr:hypothetical protein [Paraburkholderia sp.]HKR44982.1 hypothetical protein [Paraburkholderia sp.]